MITVETTAANLAETLTAIDEGVDAGANITVRVLSEADFWGVEIPQKSD